jgi:uncharacterized protein
MIRRRYIDQIDFNYRVHSVTGLLGPRQVGKTTLAHQYAQKFNSVRFFDLENAYDLAQLQNPLITLQHSPEELIIIDEVQLRPELFPTLRVLVDERPRKFLILGSASRDLLQQSSETLAGRIGYIELPPFSLTEAPELNKLWLRGGFPRSYLAASDAESYTWRQSYISTFMERDIPTLGFNIPPAHIKRFWMMLAHYHGNILNASELANSLDISNHTVRRYIDILSGTFMIRPLQPWFENVGKRQVKSPKVYIRDSGLLHTLLNIPTFELLSVYPRLGASWEGFALEEIIKAYDLQTDDCFFWSTQGGAELDLFCLHKGKRLGFEFKYTDTPRLTKSMHIASEDLKLDHLYLVHPHNRTFPLSENVTALGLQTLTHGAPAA